MLLKIYSHTRFQIERVIQQEIILMRIGNIKFSSLLKRLKPEIILSRRIARQRDPEVLRKNI
jgi:hypothetical protein